MPAVAKPAPFPRSVRTYVGRGDELARVSEWLDREILFLVYGVGGIGKSEFVYKLIEQAREQARWRDTVTILLQVRPGMTPVHALTRLRLAMGARLGPRDRAPAGAAMTAGFDDELAETARVLDARPALVFIDDLHYLDGAHAATVLGYLSRHVRESRIIAASQLEIDLPAGSPTPVITRLAPLDARDTAAMVTQLAGRLGIDRPDPDEVFRLSGGSPFFVQRLLVINSGELPASESTLDATLRELTPELRCFLLLCAILRGRLAIADIGAAMQSSNDQVDAEAAVRDLVRRFLLDVSRGEVMVHDLVRDALLRQVCDADLHLAHRVAAGLYQSRFRTDTQNNGLDAVDAIYHLIDAGDAISAWALAEDSYSAISAAGLDHLLLEALATLAGALTGDQLIAVDLMRARISIRKSQFDEAAELLDRVARRGADGLYRYLTLAGDIARRRGRLRRAEEHFVAARRRAASASERFHSAVELADIRSLRGLNDQARAVLDAAMTQFEPQNARERARWGWSMALSFVLEERFPEGARACHEATRGLAGAGVDDQLVLLKTVEALARAECNDISTARSLLDSIDAQSTHASALRAQLVSLYTGVVRYAEGRLREARVALEGSAAYLAQHADQLMTGIASYYLCRTLIGQGDLHAALRVSGDVLHIARQSEFESFVPSAASCHARALLAAGRMDEASEMARAVIAMEPERSHARWLAYTVLMRVLAARGDLAGARAQHQQAIAFAATIGADHYLLPAQLERASIELMGGDLNLAVESATAAWRGYAANQRMLLEARAAVALAAALAARGTSTDLVAAEQPLARAEHLAEVQGYPRVVARSSLVRAALLNRDGDSEAAHAHLVAAVRTLEAYVDRPEIAALRAALARADDDVILPGERAAVAALGFTGGVRYYLVERVRTRLVSEREASEERARRDLVVEPARATITVERGSRADQGRPIACELLARLIEGQGAVVTAEELFRDVWGGRQYHPLRHRNTVYVAVKRLRKTLRELLGDREVVETASGGWRIADQIDAVSIRPTGEPGRS